jgi:uncharacterized membrane protein HdeD (DUF308 family)
MVASEARERIAETGQALGGWMVLRGAITLVFGALFLAEPGAGVGVLLGLFAAFCLFDGVLLLAAAITNEARHSSWMLAIEALVSFAAGVLAWAVPGQLAVAVVMVIGARAVVVGALEVIASIRLGHTVPSPWLLAGAGLLSMVLGIALLSHPQAGLVALSWLVGVYGLLLGAGEIAAGFGLGHFGRRYLPPLKQRLSHG